jgi:hypothetical protein
MSCCDRFTIPIIPSFTGITRPHKMSIASVPAKMDKKNIWLHIEIIPLTSSMLIYIFNNEFQHKKPQTFSNCERFEVFTAVTMKNAAFWDVTPCGFCKKQRFGGTYHHHHHHHLHHQGGKNQRARNNVSSNYQCSSETSVVTRAAWRHIPEDSVLPSRHRENLKSYTVCIPFIGQTK